MANAKSAGAKGVYKKSRKESFSIYVYKVFKLVHPDTGVSSKAMSINDAASWTLRDIFELIANEASHPAKVNFVNSNAVGRGSLVRTATQSV